MIKLMTLCFFSFLLLFSANLNAADEIQTSMNGNWHEAEPETPALPQGIVYIEKMHLYNDIPTFQSRFPDPVILGNYSKKIQDQLIEMMNRKKPKGQKDGLVAVAIKPGKRMKLWADLNGSQDDKLTKSLTKSLKKVDPPSVSGGPIAFAILFKVNGFGNAAQDQIPMPEHWHKTASNHIQAIFEKTGRKTSLAIPDDILKIVWPDEV